MSGVPQQPDESETSYRLDRLAGLTVVGSIALSLVLVVIGEPLFWVPFAAGIGIGLPAFAILADRERERVESDEDAEREASDAEDQQDADSASADGSAK